MRSKPASVVPLELTGRVAEQRHPAVLVRHVHRLRPGYARRAASGPSRTAATTTSAGCDTCCACRRRTRRVARCGSLREELTAGVAAAGGDQFNSRSDSRHPSACRHTQWCRGYRRAACARRRDSTSGCVRDRCSTDPACASPPSPAAGSHRFQAMVPRTAGMPSSSRPNGWRLLAPTNEAATVSGTRRAADGRHGSGL